MTPEEKEIRAAERKALAEVRQWRRIAARKTQSMSPTELQEYYKKMIEELRAEGYKIVMLGEENNP